jgi:hypothetical protein
MKSLGEAALKLARKGLRVFPCRFRGKEPLILNNLQRATTDEKIIRAWWFASADFVCANIGVATGPGSGIWVLDVDGDKRGEATLRAWEAEHAALPETVEAITARGRHLYWKWQESAPVRNTQSRDDMPGVDVRGEGGFVLAPPSIHPTGRVYAWSVDSANEFADAPEWLIEKINRNSEPVEPRPPEDWRTFIGEAVDGSRRAAGIARLYGLLVRRWVDPVMALDICRMFNAMRCQPPLEDSEVVRIANDIAAREAARLERAHG